MNNRERFSKVGRKVSGFYFGPLPNARVAAFHVNRKRRNLFFTLTDLTGRVIGAVSAGSFVSKRKKRFSIQVVELMVRKLSLIAKTYRVVNVRIFFRMRVTYLGVAVVRALKMFGLKASLAIDVIPVPHNGCRKRKLRRL